MQILTILATGLFLAAAASDLSRRRIPNDLVAAVAFLGLLRLILAHVSAAPEVSVGIDLAAALVVFAAGAMFFQFGALGGGDVKLVAAGMLWVGVPAAGPYLMTTALAGGVLALAYILRCAVTGGVATPSLPYGVAIAIGAIAAGPRIF